MADISSPHTTRPAGLGRFFCIVSAMSFGLAAVIDLSIIASPAFAADFDGGSRTADVAGDTRLAAGLLIAGALSALAAVVRGGGHVVRALGVVLLVVMGGGVAVLTLPLLEYYT
jgi:hypothetical protein